MHSARTLKTQKTKQTVNYPCFLCISVQRRGWRAERGGDQAEGGGEGGQGTLRGSTPNPLVLYIEILVYTAFLSLRRNLFDGTGGLCGPRCWCWSGARISQEGPKRGWPRLACGGRGGAPRVDRWGEQRWGWGAPRALDWGTKVLATLLLLYFLSCGGVRSARSGWGSGGSSEPPGPSGTQSAASAPPARG